MVNDTLDPRLRSWVASAQAPGTDFPVQNLPFGVFSREGEAPRIGVAIGDQILDLALAAREGVLDASLGATVDAVQAPALNALMALGRPTATALRAQLSLLLRAHEAAAPSDAVLRSRLLVPQAEAVMHLPAHVGDYTDFYASVHHATNVGALFRPDNPLLPNYKWMPIGYHGRASSLVPDGTPVPRPTGQRKAADAAMPTVGPSQSLDYEVEIGAFIGRGNALGSPVPLAEAEDHLFGLCLVNDWSARDVQAWEYQPLGPFLGKSFATTVSPWVVTLDALAPFRAPRAARPEGDPAPLPYLDTPADRAAGAFDITIEAALSTARMRAAGHAPARLARTNAAGLYWTIGQMVAHHAMNGCNLRPGDLLASGTVSGPTPDSLGCLLELTRRGAQPVALPTGESRAFLQDGDEVIFTAFCAREGATRIGFGKCRGRIGS
ncbi:MAG: fumarylacetoacetase [Acidobacteria bacterium]|nr:fumarylacetoacetase [Acidobacteriota bacterium]